MSTIDDLKRIKTHFTECSRAYLGRHDSFWSQEHTWVLGKLDELIDAEALHGLPHDICPHCCAGVVGIVKQVGDVCDVQCANGHVIPQKSLITRLEASKVLHARGQGFLAPYQLVPDEQQTNVGYG